jgi:hypothetical protein
MKKIIILLMLVTTLFAPAVSAYKIYGSGNFSCGIWLDSSEAKDKIHQELQSWVTGFVSGASFYVGPTAKHTDTKFMFSRIDNYCQNSPLDSVGQAAASLMYELARSTK